MILLRKGRDGGVLHDDDRWRHLSRLEKVLQVDEPGARTAESFGRLALTEAVNDQPIFSEPLRQSREVTVGGHETEPVELAFRHQIHCIDYQRDVGSVLARGVAALLVLENGVRLHSPVPANELRA